MTPTEAAYLAGLVDGEGCVSVTRTRTSKSAKGCKRGFAYRSSIAITMTDLDLMKWAQELTGLGRVCTKKTNHEKHKPAWAWTVWSIEAVKLLAEIRPYLRLKARQADNLVAFQTAMRYPGAKGLSDEEWNFREARYFESKALNQRGPIK